MSSDTTFDIGDKPRITAQFENFDGTPVTPTVFTLKVRSSVGEETAYASSSLAVLTPEVGTVQFDMPYPLTDSGTWTIRVVCTEPIQAATEMDFTVRDSAFQNP